MLTFLLIVACIYFLLFTVIGNYGVYQAAKTLQARKSLGMKVPTISIPIWTLICDILATSYIIWFFFFK